MIHFGIIELLFEINTDICDSYKMDIQNDHCAHLTLVLKHILKDLGVPQMYANVIIKREDLDNMVTFTITHVSSNDGEKEKEKEKDEDYEVIPVKSIVIKFDIKNIHKIDICIDVFYDELPSPSSSTLVDVVGDQLQEKNMRNFIDKMLKTLVKNLINRLKQFIEKMPYSNNTSSNAI